MKKYILFLLIINIILSIALINKNKKTTENNIYLNSNTINIVDYLKNKSNNKEIQEYENGNIQEMFIFEHPETDQVSANTDYRYIGNNPNNYIYFNCSDNNDTSTCELWRIIGIFSVEDENGDIKEKIKIVRDKTIEQIPFDENSNNNYSESTLKTYLNDGEYFNSINDKYKEMISTAKYYLGGLDNLNVFADNFYEAERNNTTGYKFWIGKIGLIYPSDFGYIYNYGVSECNSTQNLYNCYDNKNWMINLESIGYYEGETRTITPHTNSFSVYYTRICGGITASSAGPGEYSDTNYSTNIKPTLYLNNDIYISSGTGEKLNPYIVKKIDDTTIEENSATNDDNTETNKENSNTSNASITNNQTIDNPKTVDSIFKYIKILLFASLFLIAIINNRIKKKTTKI